MTWLGKIFALLALVGSLAVVYFITVVFVTRNNWKTQAEGYKAALAKAVDARQGEYDAYRSRVESLESEVAAVKTRLVKAEEQRELAEDESAKNKARLGELTTTLATQSKTVADLNATIAVNQAKVTEAHDRNTLLENELVLVSIAREQAERERTGAVAEAARQRRIVEELNGRVEGLVSQVNELRAAGGSAQAAVLNRAGGVAVPVPENLRGTVTRVHVDPQTQKPTDLVQVSIGLDAGLTRGAVLDVYRESGGEGRYLGTVTVDTAYPKQAVGTFRPADTRRPLRGLKPDEFPRFGDTVRKLDDGRQSAAPRP